MCPKSEVLGLPRLAQKRCPCFTKVILHGTDNRTRMSMLQTSSLLLAASGLLVVLPLARDDLAKHHHAVAIHESDARKALAILERVADQRLLRCEAALRHLVRLQR